jgi:hypothetical protein
MSYPRRPIAMDLPIRHALTRTTHEPLSREKEAIPMIFPGGDAAGFEETAALLPVAECAHARFGYDQGKAAPVRRMREALPSPALTARMPNAR